MRFPQRVHLGPEPGVSALDVSVGTGYSSESWPRGRLLGGWPAGRLLGGWVGVCAVAAGCGGRWGVVGGVKTQTPRTETS